jgi:hypothetical protein
MALQGVRHTTLDKGFERQTKHPEALNSYRCHTICKAELELFKSYHRLKAQATQLFAFDYMYIQA